MNKKAMDTNKSYINTNNKVVDFAMCLVTNISMNLP